MELVFIFKITLKQFSTGAARAKKAEGTGSTVRGVLPQAQCQDEMHIFKDRYEYLKERPQEREGSRRGQVASPPPAFLFRGGWEGQEKSLARKDGCGTRGWGQRKELQIHKIILCVEMATDTHVCENYKITHSKYKYQLQDTGYFWKEKGG